MTPMFTRYAHKQELRIVARTNYCQIFQRNCFWIEEVKGFLIKFYAVSNKELHEQF